MPEQLRASLGSDERRVAVDVERLVEMIGSQAGETDAWRSEVEHGRVERR